MKLLLGKKKKKKIKPLENLMCLNVMRYLNLKAEFRLELMLYIQSKQNNKNQTIFTQCGRAGGNKSAGKMVLVTTLLSYE